MPLLSLFAGQHEALGNKFELLEPLGEGSFGYVWKARRLADDTIVALKIPRDQELGEEVLRHEPEIMQTFTHPHIVQVHGYHTIGSWFVIEMEYVAGRNLAEMLDGVNRDNPLSYQRIMQWAQQILAGLQAIHEAHVIHGDIKPLNVLINPEGQAKLVDFGTSRRMEDVWVWTRRQGTEAYWAPEVAFESKRSMVSDIYSVGVMLYEMVTGELPYRSPLQLTAGQVIKRPGEVNSNVPPALEAIILRAMARNPRDRYPDCAAMLADVTLLLEQIASGDVATPPDRTRTTRIPFRPDSSSPLFYLEEAKAYLADDDLRSALRAAETAVERSGQHPNYLRLLGGIYLRMGYLNKALETYERVLAAYQSDFPATEGQKREVLERLGKLYIKTQRYGQAVKTYQYLMPLASNLVYVKFQLAVAYGLDAEYPRAIRLLEEVRHERPDVAITYSKLGWAYRLEGDLRQALSYYNQALMIDEADLLSLFELGQYYWLIGERTRALSYFERLKRHDLVGTYTKQIEAML